MTDSERLGLRIRELRAREGITQRQLAKRSGLSFGAVRDIEQGRNHGPSWTSMTALAKGLRTSIAVLSKPPDGNEKAPLGRPVSEGV